MLRAAMRGALRALVSELVSRASADVCYRHPLTYNELVSGLVSRASADVCYSHPLTYTGRSLAG
jgi:hypothetical protein